MGLLARTEEKGRTPQTRPNPILLLAIRRRRNENFYQQFSTRSEHFQATLPINTGHTMNLTPEETAHQAPTKEEPGKNPVPAAHAAPADVKSPKARKQEIADAVES